MNSNGYHSTLRARLAPASIALVLACLAMVSAYPLGAVEYDEESTKVLLSKLKESKITLAEGIKQSEKEHGPAISAKFEMKGDQLMLSVYNAKDGLGKDAEHNELTEDIGDVTKSPWTPEHEVFEDKEHLKRSAMHLTLVQASKLSFLDAIGKASSEGTVYSIAPAVKDRHPVYDVLVADSAGKTKHLVVDANTGKVSK